jgi:Protein of unknown function (DUF3891)
MLVRGMDSDTLLLVEHTDLARLTGQLAAAWGNGPIAPLTPYLPMVIAAHEYTAGWRHWDMKPYIDLDGQPIDADRGARYLGPHWITVFEESLATLADRDAYAALVASLHWESWLSRFEADWPPGMDAAIAEQHSVREHLVDVLREEGMYRGETEPSYLSANAALLRTFEQIAQFLTTQSNAICVSSAAVELHVRRTRSDEVRIDPYPFATDPLVVSWTTRNVPNRAYTSQTEFLETFYRAPLRHPSCTLVGAPA